MGRTRLCLRTGAVVTAALAVVASLARPIDASTGPASEEDPGRAQPASGAEAGRADAQRVRAKRDPRGDVVHPRRNRHIDIRRLYARPHVRKRPQFAAVRIFGFDFPRASGKRNLADTYLNLRGTGPKPDFRVIAYLPRDGDGLEGVQLLKVRGWKHNVRVKRCPRLSAVLDARRDRVTFLIPRRCINASNGRRFQVHVRMWNVFRYTQGGQPERGWFDEVPNRLRRGEPRFLDGWV